MFSYTYKNKHSFELFYRQINSFLSKMTPHGLNHNTVQKKVEQNNLYSNKIHNKLLFTVRK